MVCDWWECRNFEDCFKRSQLSGHKYPPCACCLKFDSCELCANYIDCADLVCKYLPNMFRRLVRDIRHGDDTAITERYIMMNTLGGRKRK